VAETLDGVQGDDHLDGRAVGVGDDATGTHEGIGSIDLRYDERDILLHTEGAGVVDHHGAVLGDRLCVLEGYTPTGRDEGHVNILEVIAVLERGTVSGTAPKGAPEAIIPDGSLWLLA